MDFPRQRTGISRKRAGIGALLAAGVIAVFLLAQASRASPTVETSEIVIDTVRRGLMVSQVQAPGSLVPQHERWIAAVTAGQVQRVLVRPGERVATGTVLVELDNPDVRIQALQAESQFAAAERELVALSASLAAAKLTQRAVVAEARGRRQETQRMLTALEALTPNTIARMEMARARDRNAEAGVRLEIEEQRLQLMISSDRGHLAAQRAEVTRLGELRQFHLRRVESMSVRAGMDGVLQSVTVQLGEWANPGTILGKVIQVRPLKVVLRVPETDASQLAVGQSVITNTYTGFVPGHVSRMDPAATEGIVLVDVDLDSILPESARPNLAVEGVIELARVPDAVHVGRSVAAEPGKTIRMYRLLPNGREAVQVLVKVGRVSPNAMEILSGLSAGDRVIISDMARWDRAGRIRLR